MPLRDHFRPPLDDQTSCEGFHGQWPAMIVLALPLWLADHLAVPLELEASYEETCRVLRLD